LDLKEATLYCSERCAVVNIGHHREREHNVNTASEEAQSLSSPLASFVGSTLASTNPGLKMTPLS
jgi:hypothetical protein